MACSGWELDVVGSRLPTGGASLITISYGWLGAFRIPYLKPVWTIRQTYPDLQLCIHQLIHIAIPSATNVQCKIYYNCLIAGLHSAISMLPTTMPRLYLAYTSLQCAKRCLCQSATHLKEIYIYPIHSFMCVICAVISHPQNCNNWQICNHLCIFSCTAIMLYYAVYSSEWLVRDIVHFWEMYIAKSIYDVRHCVMD